MIGIGIVGAGYIGSLHARTVAEHGDGATILGVTDIKLENARRLADSVGCPVYETFDDMLSARNVDVLAICTPTAFHHEYVFRAVEAGRHVFCEKPLAITLEQANRMVSAVEGRDVVAMAGHVLRFWPEYVRIKEVVDSGTLGTPRHAYCERLGVIPDWAEGQWNRRQDVGGGAALDLQIHDIDYLNWVFGNPSRVQSRGVHQAELGGWAHMQTSLAFGGGVAGLVHAGWTFHGGFPFTMGVRIAGTEGTVEWLFRAGKNIEERAENVPITVYRRSGSQEAIAVEKVDPFVAEWRYFLSCVRRGRAPELATFAQARDALRVALASCESAAAGGWPVDF